MFQRYLMADRRIEEARYSIGSLYGSPASFVFGGAIIKLSVLDTSSFSAKFNDTRGLKFAGMVLDERSRRVVL